MERYNPEPIETEGTRPPGPRTGRDTWKWKARHDMTPAVEGRKRRHWAPRQAEVTEHPADEPNPTGKGSGNEGRYLPDHPEEAPYGTAPDAGAVRQG